MSLPNEYARATIKIGDGASPEVFALACGITQVSVNEVAETTDKAIRDCTTPFQVPFRTSKTRSRSLTITGSGLTDKATAALYSAGLGKSKNYKIELYKDNGTDAGLLAETISGAFVLKANNQSFSEEGDATQEITLDNNGPYTRVQAA